MSPTLQALADDAWLLQLGHRIDATINADVHGLCERIRHMKPAWLHDLVPAYASVGVFFDPAMASPEAVRDWLQALLEDLPSVARGTTASAARTIEIPVAYGGDFGPDLEAAAAELAMTPDELVRRHCAGEYTVAMIGFAPGFPYLLGLDAALALPRLPTPRASVPAGSVGIGGAQTGIYPRQSPGGWRLIGRTSLVLFDPAQEPPALLAPGDRVRFVAVHDASAMA